MNEKRKLALELQQINQNWILDNNKIFYLIDNAYILDYICIAEFIETGYKLFNQGLLREEERKDLELLLYKYKKKKGWLCFYYNTIFLQIRRINHYT